MLGGLISERHRLADPDDRGGGKRACADSRGSWSPQAAAELRAVGDPSLGKPSGSEDVRYRVLARRRTAIDLE
jgi:hypothetical protein